MAKKARQRISYVLPLASSTGGHRLGVNGLAVDTDQSILYSAGRDGVICAWNLNLNLDQNQRKPSSTTNPFNSPEDPPAESKENSKGSTLRNLVQAHTHWVNDIILAQSNTALVSASSDITVKVWRPQAEDGHSAKTIGLHSDYVKCLASPETHSDWVASGGLDHKIRLWDLNGGGEKLQIDVGEDENSAKGSIYALSVRGSIMASGGPESIVRLWDPKSGKRITKLVGHTDNVRDILINQDGDTVMTASSDQTIKVWSMAAGRCLYTLSMHNDSVWTLHSDHPQLSVFYSGDRSGLIAKTDTRGSIDLDQGLSIAIAQEHGGANKVVAAGDYIWTATSSSSINRWNDFDLGVDFHIPEPRHHRGSSLASRTKIPSPTQSEHKQQGDCPEKKLPLNCILRISNASLMSFPKLRSPEFDQTNAAASGKKSPEEEAEEDLGIIVPYQRLPVETIEGQNGLIKHVMLNDRKRVLTLDTAGEVVMWDLLKCVPIQSFGKRHLEDVTPEVNTLESVANWCGVDTRTGRLAVLLEENYCFDAEMYADELGNEEGVEFRDDQRINLGKWVLRYLFANLIEEEVKRDEYFRQSLQGKISQGSGLQRDNAPASIQLPPVPNLSKWQNDPDDDDSVITPRANGHPYPPMTPGLSIGIATPGVVPLVNHGTSLQNHLPPTAEEGTPSLEKRQSQSGQPRTSGDYFSSNTFSQAQTDTTTPAASSQTTDTPLQSPSEPDKGDKAKESGSIFGKKFRMNFPKKLGRSSVEVKPAPSDEKVEESDKSSEREEKIVEDNFLGVVQKIRYDYEDQLHSRPNEPLLSGLTPSLPNETPILRPPSYTTVLIQEDRPDSGGVADIYRGTVASVGKDANMIEKAAPMWLGDLLLKNQIPVKDTVKVSFVLQPYQDLLPSIASSDGNSRLNANRMLRAKKILAYVAERIEAQPEHPDPNTILPEEFLELYCQDKKVPLEMTLATLRAHVWKTGGDVMLYYKSNGRRPELELKPIKDAGTENTSAASAEAKLSQ